MTAATHSVSPEEIMALLDGELAGAEAESVRAHLGECAECAAVAEDLRRTSQALAQWTVPTAPERMEGAIRNEAAIASGERLKQRMKPSYGIRSKRFWAIGGGGALAGALMVIAALVASSGSRSGSPYKARALGYVETSPPPPPPADAGSLPLNGRNFSDLVTLSSPGVAPDSNGLFHGLGDHAADSFSVDGQPPTDQKAQFVNGLNRPLAGAAQGPMIARTASLSIVTRDMSSARAALNAILARRQGYAAQLNIGTPQSGPRTIQASLRIPAPALAAAMADLRTLGRVENESQAGEEVTAQHTDLVERLKTARETEERFRAILTERTGNASEILQVEEGIARVRGDIERMEREQQGLEHRVEFASVDVQLTEEYKEALTSAPGSFSLRMHNAVVDGFRNAWETVLGIVLFLVAYGPSALIWLAIVAVPAIFIWRRYRRMRARI
jgi:hypothetical protein